MVDYFGGTIIVVDCRDMVVMMAVAVMIVVVVLVQRLVAGPKKINRKREQKSSSATGIHEPHRHKRDAKQQLANNVTHK